MRLPQTIAPSTLWQRKCWKISGGKKKDALKKATILLWEKTEFIEYQTPMIIDLNQKQVTYKMIYQ